MRRAAALAAALVALGAGGPGRVQASARAAAATRSRVEKDTVAGGAHWRIQTSNGPVHVWRPAGYDPASAGTVVYVHGYHISVDGAWTGYQLARQFRASRQNALFVVPEAPASNADEVYWPALGELLKVVRRHTRQPLPDGPVVAIGHSGAFRTLSSWLDYGRLDYVVLLDALYGGSQRFADWLESMRGHRHNRLLVVSADTLAQTEDFLRGFKRVARRAEIPDSYGDFTGPERRARVLYLRSQYGHMELVTEGRVIPLLLRLTPLRRL